MLLIRSLKPKGGCCQPLQEAVGLLSLKVHLASMTNKRALQQASFVLLLVAELLRRRCILFSNGAGVVPRPPRLHLRAAESTHGARRPCEPHGGCRRRYRDTPQVRLWTAGQGARQAGLVRGGVPLLLMAHTSPSLRPSPRTGPKTSLTPSPALTPHATLNQPLPMRLLYANPN